MSAHPDPRVFPQPSTVDDRMSTSRTQVRFDGAEQRNDSDVMSYAEWVRQRECGDKRGYGHQLEARRAILRIAKAGGQDMREYRCEHCALWHLTSRMEESA